MSIMSDHVGPVGVLPAGGLTEIPEALAGPVGARTPTCGTCRYWKPLGAGVGGATVGECRVRGPVVLDSRLAGRWPQTARADWCGDYAELAP